MVAVLRKQWQLRLWRCVVSGTEQKDLASFLFDRTDINVLDIKFLRGRDHDLSPEEHCAITQGVLADFFAHQKPEKLPIGRTAQRNVADILQSR